MAERVSLHTWDAVREQLRARLPEAQFRAWIAPLRPRTGRDDDPLARGEGGREALTLRVPNEQFREGLGRECLGQIEAAAQAVTGERPVVHFEVDASLDVPGARAAAAQIAGLGEEAHLNDNYTFAHFVVGAANRLAYVASVAVAAAPGKVYNPLFLHGASGTGKSHLLQAIAHKLVADGADTRVLYTSCEGFVNRFLTALERGQLAAFRRQCRRADVLLLDDVQFLARAPRSQEEFFHTFNALYDAGRQIVLTAASPPDDAPGIEPRLSSRFRSGLVARIEAPSAETSAMIVQTKARALGRDLDDEVARWIAERCGGSVRELEGDVVRVIGYASLSEKTIDLELARNALDAGPGHAVTLGQILDCVSRFFGVSRAELRSPRRHRSVARPRQISIYLARQLTNLSLDEIGESLGGRDHSTVLYAIRRIRKEIEQSEQLGRRVKRLTEEIERMAGSPTAPTKPEP